MALDARIGCTNLDPADRGRSTFASLSLDVGWRSRPF
jgi:hypothetical protein